MRISGVERDILVVGFGLVFWLYVWTGCSRWWCIGGSQRLDFRCLVDVVEKGAASFGLRYSGGGKQLAGSNWVIAGDVSRGRQGV